MPTHQGKTQTDIVIGDGGDSVTLDASLEYFATYGSGVTANFQYKDNASGANHEDSNYEIKISDASGVIATWAAKYTADPVTGSATNVTTTRTNTFTPTPNGNSPTYPASPATSATRDWVISSTKGGSTFAGFDCRWECASTVATGGSVSQTVNIQNNAKLKVTLTYTVGGSTVLTVIAICYAKATETAGVTLGAISRTDTIVP
jgi:hypothetical protein